MADTDQEVITEEVSESMCFIEGFDQYGGVGEFTPTPWGNALDLRFSNGKQDKVTMSQEFGLPRRPWWKRLFSRRPAGTLYMNFHFASEKPGGETVWHNAEAMAEYPAGTERVRVTMETLLNGDPILFNRPPDYADMGPKK